MKYTENEILNALNIIKEMCINANDCKECPFRERINNSMCYFISKIPMHWGLVPPSENEWRAFND